MNTNPRLYGFATAIMLFATSTSSAVSTFRGVPRDQAGNLHSSDVLGRSQPWFIDVQDTFQRSEPLSGSLSDQWRIGFVPPHADSPLGSLAGHADGELVGRWMGADDYVVDGGRAFRETGTGVSLACVPWRVTPGLGNNYLVEMVAHVAAGESVRLGYFGDVLQLGPGLGLLHSPIGQLVLDVTRGADNVFDWTVKWDDGEGRSFVGSDLVLNAADAEEFTMQLGWNDVQDTFEARLRTDAGTYLLAQGGMSEAIDVFGAGFEMTGSQSYAMGFLAAVPEPATGWLAAGTTCLWVLGRRRARNENRSRKA